MGETISVRPVGPAASVPDAGHLLVLERQAASRFPLPLSGELIIGRAPECGLCLPDPSVSRQHARLRLSPGEASIVDLGSRNGTRVNGEPAPAAGRALCSGDVIGVGDFTLVLQRKTLALAERPLLDLPALRQRLEEELDRARRSQRPLSLLCLRGDGPADRPRLLARLAGWLRLSDSACCSAAELLLLWPERQGELLPLVERLARALAPAWPGLRAGLATYPEDGDDSDALLSTARQAAAAAAAGEAADARRLCTTLTLGERTVVVADPAMARLYALLRRLAQSDLPVLLCGETGTGKEVAAAALHQGSRRHDRPLVTLNCAAVPPSLFESELFGHERGAFSGAVAARKGYLEQADGGTLFLDELGELPLEVQAKLLRALETQRYARLGDPRERAVNVRLVAATNRDLEAESRAGRFRADLYFRVGAARLTLPPLRERGRELPLLARTLLRGACARAGRPPLRLSQATLQALRAHAWPGNVRELRNAMDYVASTCAGPEEEVEPWHLPDTVYRAEVPAGAAADEAAEEDEPPGQAPPLFRPIAAELRDVERARMLQALQATGWLHGKAAALIGMPKRTFATKFKLYGLGEEEGAGGARSGGA